MRDHEEIKRRRERWLILLVLIILIATTYFEVRLSNLSQRLPFVNSVFFFGLVNFNIMLLMVLVLLIARNVGKIFLERRRQILGSRLKTKLVLSFLSFSIFPTIILFLISSLYINSSFDKWFSLKIQNTLQTSLEMTQTYYKSTSRVAQYLATQVSHEIRARWPVLTRQAGKGASFHRFLDNIRTHSAVDYVEVYTGPLAERVVAAEAGPGDLDTRVPRLPLDVLTKVFKGEKVTLVQHISGADLIRAAAPLTGLRRGQYAVVAVTFVIPASLVNRVDEISSVFQDYKETNPLKYPVKTTYFIILIMMTVLILFVSIWIGLYLARELTVPLERLVKATQRISQGELDFQVLNIGHDEIAKLTESFNQMTTELNRHRSELEEKNGELAEKNAYVEALLSSISAGVIAIDRAGYVVLVNPSALRLLNLAEENLLGRHIDEVSKNGQWPFSELFRTALKGPTSEVLERQFFVGHKSDSEEERSNLKVTASFFRGGIILVVDDASQLARVQRETAWREVARRIAHEIKNPLTPIKLSAQRIQRRLDHLEPNERQVAHECIHTIIKNVDELRDMVNEFSHFARLPALKPSKNQINDVIHEALILYREAHKNIAFQEALSSDLPEMIFDRDQIKRVLVNLIDNATNALHGEVASETLSTSSEKAPLILNPKIKVSTRFDPTIQLMTLEVEDNGPGIPENLLNRLFEPYFSTRTDGTGLGLAIVKRIISDHDGFVRVQSVQGRGTKFIIELPTHAKNNPHR